MHSSDWKETGGKATSSVSLGVKHWSTVPAAACLLKAGLTGTYWLTEISVLNQNKCEGSAAIV